MFETSGFGFCPFGHAANSGSFGHGPFPTFPYTPGFSHGAGIVYIVDPNLFTDFSEQRYLRSREQGFSLSYEFAFPSSATVSDVTSFFQDAGGPYRRFLVLDHRLNAYRLVRFADAFTHTRGPAMLRGLQVVFNAVT